mgnify:FL=1
MICQHCGAPLETGVELCPFCGSPTPYDEMLLDEKIQRKQALQRKKKLEGLAAIKHVSGLSLPFLWIATLGIYSPVWYLTRAQSLNRMNSPKKLPLLAALLQLALCLGVLILPGSWEEMGVDAETASTYNNCVFGASFLLSIWLAFRVKDILWAHASQYLEKAVVVHTIAPSVTLLVVFGPLYLQTQINKMIFMELLTPSV